MHELGVLLTFTGVWLERWCLGFFAQRLKLSPIIGYPLAGVAVGPFTPGFVANRAIAEQFAEIGVILLLFGIGLRFNLQELFAVWRVAIPGALIPEHHFHRRPGGLAPTVRLELGSGIDSWVQPFPSRARL